MRRATIADTVRVLFTGRLEDGTVLDSTVRLSGLPSSDDRADERGYTKAVLVS